MTEPPRPAWQTDELEEEWIEPDTDNEELTLGTRSISFTEPLVVHIRRSLDDGQLDDNSSPTTPEAAGTFLVRQDQPAAPLLPKTPGRNKKGLVNDFFSPLPLERMFEPPSPPVDKSTLLPQSQTTTSAKPSLLAQTYISGFRGSQAEDDRAEDEIVETDVVTFPPKAQLDCRFTFAIPRHDQPNSLTPGAFPQAQSTPGPPQAPASTTNNAPMTDPRLRLFQFQYDTFTRDHLSAMVDSIAVNTPSGGSGIDTGSQASFSRRLSRVSEATAGSTSHLRSSKRVKLSPASDYYGEGDGDGAVIARPKIFGKDYVGESRSLMQQIKQARDFSTISTAASAQSPASHISDPHRSATHHTLKQTPEAARPAFLDVPEKSGPPSSDGTDGSKRGSYSSLAFRQQAADLMAQIKNDMKGSKRLFSDGTEISHFTQAEPKSFARSPSPEEITRHTDDKENSRNHPHRHHQVVVKSPPRSHASSVASRARQKASPRKLLRRLSAADEVDRELAGEISNMSIDEQWQDEAAAAQLSRIPISNGARNPSAAFLAPPTNAPSYPTSSVRSGPNDDLNRFVSSSTTSGTTLTAGSVPSFVKHSGPMQITRIGPSDVPAMDRVGKMVFDKVMMKWVKTTAAAAVELPEDDRREHTSGTEGSEDPFRDIESLREDDSRATRTSVLDDVLHDQEGESSVDRAMTRIDEAEEHEDVDDEEIELNSFSFDGPSAGVVQVMTGVDETDELEDVEDDATTDSEDEDGDEITETTETTEEPVQDDAYDSDEDLPAEPNPEQSSPRHVPEIPLMGLSFSTPHRASSAAPSSIPRSVLKSASVTPVSAMKDASRNKHQTPAHRRGHRRSVSFSDGKRDGPILGLGRNILGGDQDQSTFVPSARSKRIADMMEGLENEADYDNEDSPSKTSSSGRPPSEEIQLLTSRRPTAHNSSSGSMARRVFSRSQTHRPSPAGNRGNANATFLTECSFGVAHDRLVQVITDVQPYEPYWEDITSIDLSKKNIESVARLKEFLPKLDCLTLNHNQLPWLSGIPGTVRTLSVASNILTGISSFSHILNLENLDISHNDIDSLRQLECLRHLRELRADNNQITSVDGLQKMDGLVKLSLQTNHMRDIDVTHFQWSRLEMLNVSHNRLDSVAGLSSLSSLVAFNADSNSLVELEPKASMPRLRILRVSGNRLNQLNAAHFPNLRTLYADNNSLGTLAKADRLTKLENLSLRNQGGRGFNISTRHVRDVKRLYLSGNPLKTGFIQEPCYNLVYLELAACRLTALPTDLARLVPNLRVLNLNYNFLEDARPLEGLTRLKKLTIIGSRLKGTKPLIRLLQRMPDAEMLDFRMNPCTLGWYLPLLVRDVPGALQPSEGSEGKAGAGRGEKAAWQELDSKFRRDLPDEAYIGRLAYRGLVMRACPGIRMLDGVQVTEKERIKANHLLEGILGKGKRVKARETEDAQR